MDQPENFIPMRKRTLGWFEMLTTLATYGIFAALLLPLVLVIWFSFNNSNSLSWPFAGFSLRWYLYVLTQPRIYEVSLTSLKLAAATAPIATIIGTAGGYALARYKFWGKAWLDRLKLLPIVMPWLMIALGLVVFLISIGMKLGFSALLIGHVTITLPFAILIIQTRVASFDTKLEDASRDLGANRWVTFRRVVFPLISPAVRAAFLFSMVISFNEVIIAFFLAGYDTTLPVYMFGQFLRVITPEVNAISGFMVALAAILLIFEHIITRAVIHIRDRE